MSDIDTSKFDKNLVEAAYTEFGMFVSVLVEPLLTIVMATNQEGEMEGVEDLLRTLNVYVSTRDKMFQDILAALNDQE